MVARGGAAGQAADRLRVRLEADAFYHLMVASRQEIDRGRSFAVQVLAAPIEALVSDPEPAPADPPPALPSQPADTVDLDAAAWRPGPFLLPGRIPIGRSDRRYLPLGDDPLRPTLLVDDAGGSIVVRYLPEADPPLIEWHDDQGRFQIISDDGERLRIREGHAIDGLRAELVIDRPQASVQVLVPGQAPLQRDQAHVATGSWRSGERPQPGPEGMSGILRPQVDAIGRVVGLMLGHRRVVEFQYAGDRRHPQRQVTILGHETRFELDDADRPLVRHDPDGTTTVYAYDDAARRYTIRHGAGPRQSLIEDEAGRLQASDDGTGRQRRYRWLDDQLVGLDLEGLDRQDFLPFGGAALSLQASDRTGTWISRLLAPGLIERLDPDGQAVFFVHDPHHRLQRIVDAEEVAWASFRYDDQGRCVQATSPDETIDISSTGNRITQQVHMADVQLTTELGDDGRPLILADSLGHQIRYQYDDDGLLTGLHHSRAGSFRITYDALGQMIGLERPNGVHSTWHHDARQRVHGWEHVLPDGRRLAQRWDHDDQERMIQRRIDGDRPLITRYDAALWEVGLRSGGSSRIERELWGGWRLPGAVIETTDDGRLRHWRAADGALSLAVTYDWDHRPLRLTLTGRRSLTLALGYDAWGRVCALRLLEGSDQSIGDGLRLVYHDDQVYAVRRQGGGVDSYLRLPGSGLVVALIRADGSVLYPLADHHGSLLWYCDAAAAVVHVRDFDPGASPIDPAALVAGPCILGAFGQIQVLDGMLLLTPGRWWWTPARRALSLGGVRPGQPRLFDHDPFAFPPAL